MKKIIVNLVVLCTLTSIAKASPWESGTIQPTEESAPKSRSRFAEHVNYFSVGPSLADAGFGISLGYAIKLSPQLKLGIQFSSAQGSRSAEAGNLDAAQYYKDNFAQNATLSALNLSFYPRDEGVSRWGPFIRASVGYARMKTIAGWGRYDRDPGFFSSGNKRLVEHQSSDKVWGTVFTRLGAYYQFAWNFSEAARVGHVLELGGGLHSLSNVETITYTKPNGVTVNNHPEYASAFGEVHYVIAF